jgi:iron complex outermembrane receptor protein
MVRPNVELSLWRTRINTQPRLDEWRHRKWQSKKVGCLFWGVTLMSNRSAFRGFVFNSQLAAAVSIALAGTAHAQTQSGALEEIVVTAERRELNLQEVPASATVLTADSLARMGIDNVIEIQQAAPAVAINSYNRSTFVNIRGVGIAQSAPTSNPGVAFYLDGNFFAHEHFIAHSFYDIESIEVLRGPQGTLTGQNSTGGAVYMRTPTPDFDEFSGYVDLTAADYDWRRAVGAVNVPMGDVVAVRLAATYDERDSFTDNIGSSPTDPGSSDLKGARATVRIKPTDGMTFDLRYEYFDLQSGYNAVKNRNDAVTADPFTIEEDAISYLDQKGYRAGFEARIDLGSSLQLRALTSYFDSENFDQADGDRTSTAPPVPAGLPANGTNTRIYPGRVGYTSQYFETSVTEVNLLSQGDSPLQWVVGAFYLDETTPTQVLRDNYSTVTLGVPNSVIDTVAYNESQSVFGQIDWRIVDSFAIDFGLRYSEDQQDYKRNMVPGNPPGCFPCTNGTESDEVTGRAGVKFFASDDAMLYATLSRGYKAGGVNLDPRLGAFGPETNEVFEIGAKTEVLDGRLRINGDVFYSIYDGVQLSALRQIGGVGPFVPNTLNGPEARIYGLELEMQGQFGGFGFNFGGAFTEAQFNEAGAVTDSQANQALFPTSPIVEGQGMPFAPAYTINGGVEYEMLFGGDMSLTPRLQASYIDEQFATPFKYPETRVPSRTVVDARLTFKPNSNLTVEAFASNLLDREYIAVQLQNASSADGGYIFGPPRQYGARLKYSF